MRLIRVQDAPIRVEEALSAIEDRESGGHAMFLGTVRNQFEGRASVGLFYDAYPELAEKEMDRVAGELEAEFPILHVAMIHRTGELALGDIAVLVAVSAPHRHAAIQACQAGIDRIKARAPIWKKERWAEGGDAWHDDPGGSSDGS